MRLQKALLRANQHLYNKGQFIQERSSLHIILNNPRPLIQYLLPSNLGLLAQTHNSGG